MSVTPQMSPFSRVSSCWMSWHRNIGTRHSITLSILYWVTLMLNVTNKPFFWVSSCWMSWHRNIGTKTLNIMTLSIIIYIMPHSAWWHLALQCIKCNTQHNYQLLSAYYTEWHWCWMLQKKPFFWVSSCWMSWYRNIGTKTLNIMTLSIIKHKMQHSA